MIWVITLGGVRIYRDGSELAGLSAHKQSLALLSYLALAGPVGRDRLLGVFWAERSEEKARHTLSQAIYALRKDVGEDVLDARGDQVGVVKQVVAVDAGQLEEAAARENWEVVSELYGGPFLDHFVLPRAPEFEHWQTTTRERISRLARRALSRLVDDRQTRGDLKSALKLAWRWAELDTLDDEAQHMLIALLARSGRRKGALSHYADYRERLAREMEVDPLEATVALVERIRAGEPIESSSFPKAYSLRSEPPEPQAATSPPQSGRAVHGPASFTTDDLEMLLKGELGPRLQLIRPLGEGSTSRVYLAREPQLRRLVAIKVFAPRQAADSRTRQRFEREAQAIASISHPNVVTVFWAGSLTDQIPYIVMQFVKGRTLENRIAAHGGLELREGLRVVAAVSSALAAAHLRGIVHRDVRSNNVLCEEETGRMLLSDFGLAAVFATGDFEPPPRLTLTGELLGKPRYMSPEQLAGERASEASDVYGLALLAYEALTGEGPYEGESDLDYYDAHVHGRPRRLRELRRDVPEEFDELLWRCLAKEPRQRPSASAIVRALS